jgi:hypothetical protein
MPTLNDLSWNELRSLQVLIRESLKGCAHLEDAAQSCASLLYETFNPPPVLVRLYGSVPFSELPRENREFVSRLAEQKRITPLIDHRTPVLSLMGSRGARPTWNDRRLSKGHLGIPLCDAGFVETIPMMARLLIEMGIGLKWMDARDLGSVPGAMDGGLSGLFHVKDARTAMDMGGRHIIPDQGFVNEHDVRTVFGVGGSYVGGMFVVLVIFTQEIVERSVVQRLVPIVNVFKSATIGPVMRGSFFRG